MPSIIHKNQDGYVYIRVRRFGRKTDGVMKFRSPFKGRRTKVGVYNDNGRYTRIITSRRVEAAMKDADYMKRCDEARLDYCRFGCGQGKRQWIVGRNLFISSAPRGTGDTLAEAYHRYLSLSHLRALSQEAGKPVFTDEVVQRAVAKTGDA